MPNRGNAAKREAAVASTSSDKYPPIKAGLRRDADTFDLGSLIRSIPEQVGATALKRGDRKSEVFKVIAKAGGTKSPITRESGEDEETISDKEPMGIKKFGEPI